MRQLRPKESLVERMRNSAGHQIRRCHQRVVALFMEELDGYDLTPVQFSALTAIVEFPDIDATRLARMVAFDRSTVGSVLERLEAKGLIEREYRRDDRRTKRVRATPAGRALLRDADASAYRSQDRFLAVLEPRERRELHRLLDKIIRAHEEREAS